MLRSAIARLWKQTVASAQFNFCMIENFAFDFFVGRIVLNVDKVVVLLLAMQQDVVKSNTRNEFHVILMHNELDIQL